MLGLLSSGIDYKITRWLHEQTSFDSRPQVQAEILRPSGSQTTTMNSKNSNSGVPRTSKNSGTWEDRKEAGSAILRYLSDPPSTVSFLYGPAGSGKATLIKRIVGESSRYVKYTSFTCVQLTRPLMMSTRIWPEAFRYLFPLFRPTLIIDCKPICNPSSDALVIRNLANQTGYTLVFEGLAWVNKMIDMASVEFIGQTGGCFFPSSLLSRSLQTTLVLPPVIAC